MASARHVNQLAAAAVEQLRRALGVAAHEGRGAGSATPRRLSSASAVSLERVISVRNSVKSWASSASSWARRSAGMTLSSDLR